MRRFSPKTARALVRRSAALRVLACVLFAGGLTAPRHALGQEIATSAAAKQQAAKLFTKGRALFRQDKIESAYEAFREAWSLHRAPEIAANLATAELELGRYRDAAEHLAFALIEPAPGTTPATLDALEAALGEAKRQIGTLKLSIEPSHSTIRVDDIALSSAALRREIYLEPGEHTIAAAAPGYAPSTRTIWLEPGETLERTIELRSLQRIGAAAAPKPAAAAQGVAPNLPLPLVRPASDASGGAFWRRRASALTIGGAITVAATGTALSFLRATKDANDQADAFALECNGWCNEESRAQAAAETNRTVSALAFAAAGGAAIGTTLYILMTESSPSLSHRAQGSHAPVWIGGAIAAVGIATGIALLARAESSNTERAQLLTELRRPAGKNACGPGTPHRGPCDAIQGRVRTYNLNRNLALTSFATAGIGAIGAIGYLVVPSETENETRAAGLLFQSAGHTLVLRGAF